MPLKKVFSLTKLADMVAVGTGESGKPTMDVSAKKGKTRSERRRKEKSRSRSPKRNSHNDLLRLLNENNNKKLDDDKKKRRSANDLLQMQRSDVDDIYDMVQKLKGSSEGQKILNEFVDYQTGKTTTKPRMLVSEVKGGEDDGYFLEGDSSEFNPPSEIFIVGGNGQVDN